MRTAQGPKKLLRAIPMALCLVAAAFFLMPAQSAEAGKWTWKKYRLKFWLPKGMKATKKARYAFIAKGKGIVLKISPWKSRRTTSRKAARYGWNTYRIIKRKKRLYKKRLKKRGAWVQVLVGTGWVGRSKVYFAVMGLAGKRSSNNFYVRMWWKKWRHKWVKPRVNRIARSLQVY